MLLFDKSFLQSLNIDEAAILDQLFACIVTPLFFAETLGSLAKEPRGGRKPEAIVASLAEKTPVAHSYMNSFHSHLILDEVLGTRIDMGRRPQVAGGVPVIADGKAGFVFKKSDEVEAFERWQRGQFKAVEHIVARAWRENLRNLDLPGIADAFKSLLKDTGRPKDHEQALSFARAVVDAPGHTYKSIMLACEFLGVDPDANGEIIRVWKRRGRKPLREFAPYAAHCLLIDMYFYFALSNGLVSDQRASNKIDIGYLYYLPFAQIFVSGDRLHRTAGELFLEKDQTFVWGPDLKADLSRLNAEFLALPAEEKAKGLFTLVSKPPVADQGLVASLWDKLRPGWREPKPEPPKMTKQQSAQFVERSNRFIEASEGRRSDYWPRGFPPEDKVDHIVIERHIPRVRGSWRMFSEDVEKQEDERR